MEQRNNRDYLFDRGIFVEIVPASDAIVSLFSSFFLFYTLRTGVYVFIRMSGENTTNANIPSKRSGRVMAGCITKGMKMIFWDKKEGGGGRGAEKLSGGLQSKRD